MICDHHYVKNGKTAGGSQRWRCTLCPSTYTEGDRKRGRPKSGKALTSTERSRRWRAKRASEAGGDENGDRQQ